MPKTTIPFGKIAATPSATSWSQSYSAGSLFLTLSFMLEEQEEQNVLHTTGKKFINDLEAEFFALEEKSLSNIKNILTNLCVNLPEAMQRSIALAFIKEKVLYLFLSGPGSIILKRKDQLGTLLEETNPQGKTLQSSSGFLEDEDIVMLQTEQFRSIIPQETLIDALQSPNLDEASEILSPLIHNTQEGGAAAIFFSYHAEQASQKDDQEESDIETIPHEKQQAATLASHLEDVPSPTIALTQHASKRRIALPLFAEKLAEVSSGFFHLSHRRKVLLSIVFLLLLTLVASITFTMQSSKSASNKAVFEKTFIPAKKHFDEGEGLLSLNTALALEEFTKAEKLLKEGRNKLPQGSKEEKEITTLLTKVTEKIQEASGSKSITANVVADDASRLLSIRKKSKDNRFVTQDADSIYALTSSSVIAYPKNGDKEKKIITNEKDWQDMAGLGTFYGNIYILDQKEGILKFTKAQEGFGKSQYLQGDKSELSQAVSMAIDSSVYVLTTDGTVNKYTRGAKDAFTLRGLDKQLSKPTSIYTNQDISNIYILDNGNSRIVKLDKSGALQAQYQAVIIKNALDLDINEQDKKAYVLANNKIYELQLE